MRELSSGIQTLLTQKLGLEPVNILEVQWVNDGQWLAYADKDITDYEFNIGGKILEVGTLESVVKLDSQGQSQTITAKLSDTKGDLKNIFDNHDIHGRRCKLYQWFENISLSERFKLYEGEISSPIVWDEGDRTLSFEVITQLADKEIGFSPEEGYFEFLPEAAYGKPWPLVFGMVQNVPAVLLNEIPNSLTAESLGVGDPTIFERLQEIGAMRANLQSLLYFYALGAAQAAFTCDFGDTPDQRSAACSAYESLVSAIEQITGQMLQIDDEIRDLLVTQMSQNTNTNSTLTVMDGKYFPQNQQITLQSGTVRLVGSFDGDMFNITNLSLMEYTGYEGTPFGFTWQQEGTTITIQSDCPIVYIVNLLPSEVHYVQAFKQVENGEILSTVPSEYYTVATEDVGPYIVTYIKFIKPLSSYDETFRDDIYVSQTSSVGPNTVDIIRWLIETYTDMSIDETSFDYVKTKLENYPSHFALLERKNILEAVEEIAFQARCSIWIADRTFYIRYLSEEQTEVATLTESDVDTGSLKVKLTTTEDIVTKLTAQWREDYSVNEKNLVVLRHNVTKYGLREREIDFYIYNIFDLVMKSATFWLIRFSNSWKNLKFTTYLDQLALETFDTVEFNFATPFIADSAIKGVLTSSVYDSAEKMIEMEAWLPVKCGSMERYDFAEPHDISIELFFPTQVEIDAGFAGGGGPGEYVEGGLELTERFKRESGYSSSLSRRSQGQRIQGRDWGEQTPSDLDDEKPTPRMQGYPIAAGVQPYYAYAYPPYDLDLSIPVEEREFSYSFPGKIISFAGGSLYNVDVYQFGLSNDPTREEVRQLQIAVGEPIPVNTWVLVAFNRWEEEVDDETVVLSEYTMQVPVWL